MMKKFYLIAAAAAAVLVAGCAKNEVIQKPQEMTPITFGTYTARTATKAVSSTSFGQINTDALLQASVGFGVFAYYSDGASNDYDGTNFIPNFMYNQKVAYEDTTVPVDGIADAWTYSPIKYWPNEYDNTDITGAISADIDKLSFFAYAPHVTNLNIAADKGVSISDGAGTPAAADEGIIAMTANDATGDPTLTFKVPANEANQIDLLRSDAATQNLTKRAIDGKVIFTFKHALSNLTILPIAVVDTKTTIPASSGKDVATGTHVKVNSITVTGKFNQQGTLNLATGVWSSSAAATDQTVTYAPATALDVTLINDKAEANTKYGANPSDFPEFMFIPSSSAQDYVITINYDFITTDAAVDGGTVTVHNVIHKTLSSVNFQEGKKLKLYVGLGMTTVLFDASVADWMDVDPAMDVWLPVNL